MLYPIQDSRPALATGDAALEWWAGGGAFALASSAGVRVNFRGVHLYAPDVRIRAELRGWTRVPCNQSASALCCSDVGCVLPAAAPRMPEGPVEAGWGGLGCADGKGKQLVSLGVYDISACDIMDEGLDVLYTAQGELYHRRTGMPLWRYWACVGLAIILVRGLSYNVQGLWTPGAAPPRQQWVALAAALVLAALVVPFDDLDGVFVTLADQTFYWATVGYIGAYLVLQWRASQPVFNVIVAALQLLAMRLYTAAESPYNLVLIAMLASRVWVKVLSPQLHGGALVLDSLYLALCVELAFNDTLEAIVAVAGVAFVIGRLLVMDSTQSSVFTATDTAIMLARGGGF
jgi:hypothetical protein